MNCRIAQELMSRFIDGDLGSDEEKALDQHIQSCTECEKVLAELRAGVDLVRGLPAVSVPARLTPDTIAIVRRESSRQGGKNRRSLWYMAAAAAALMVVVVGASGLLASRDRMADAPGYAIEPSDMQYVQYGSADKADEDTARSVAPPSVATDAEAGSEKIASYPSGVSYERKTVMTADLRITSEEFDEAQNRVALIVEREGGYVQHSNMWTVTREGNKYRAMNVLMRIPSEAYNRVVSELTGLGELDEKSESGRDVTEEYYDIDARVRNLQRQEDRLLELLGRANTVDEILRVESELARVRGGIEQATGRLRYLDHVVAMSAISVTIQEPLPDQTPPEDGFWGRLVAAFMRTLRWIKSAGEKALVLLAGALPFVVAGVVIWLGVRHFRR